MGCSIHHCRVSEPVAGKILIPVGRTIDFESCMLIFSGSWWRFWNRRQCSFEVIVWMLDIGVLWGTERKRVNGQRHQDGVKRGRKLLFIKERWKNIRRLCILGQHHRRPISMVSIGIFLRILFRRESLRSARTFLIIHLLSARVDIRALCG